MKLALIFNKEREDTIGCYFERAAQEMGILFDHYWTKDADKIAKEYDLYLRIDHGDYKYDLPTCLKPSAFYVVDTHLKKPYKKIRQQVKHYNYIFCAQKEGAERLKRDVKVNAVWIPIGCDPQIHKRLDIEKKFDVGFVGTDGKKSLRKILLRELAAKYPNSFLGMAPYTKMSEIYSGSKIGFNYSLNNDINMRMFEVMACGAMLITNEIEYNGFDELFEEGRNVVTYNTQDKLFKVIDYYLNHDDERERIANEGYNLVTIKHTYKHRLVQMLDFIKEDIMNNYKNIKI